MTDSEYCNDKVLFHSHRPHLSRMQRHCFSLAGFDERRVQIVDRPLRIKNLIIPEPGFVISSLFHPQHADFLGKIPSGSEVGARIWLSRSKLPDVAGRIVDESDLEDEIIKDGWIVIHPETLSLVDQVKIFANASVVAGLEGSAFHTVIFVKNPTCRLLIIPRTRRENDVHNNYKLISNTKNIDQRIFPGNLRIIEDNGYRSNLAFVSRADVRDFLNAESA